MPRKRFIHISLYTFLAIFIFANVLAYNHARKFTRFSPIPETDFDADNLSFPEKLKYACTGVDNPRPCNKAFPAVPYETKHIKSNEDLECWLIRADSAKGTVLMFHGYKSDKSELLERAYIFNKAGYNTMLVDFMGSGGSGGNEVTIGYHEARNVNDCYDYIMQQGEKNIILFGISMGAAAIMKAVAEESVKPALVIIEAPFGSMLQAVSNRFENMHFPTFPMAQLLVFWGGLQNGFWAFDHNPADYAKKVNCPALVIYGAKDDRVKMNEIQSIKNNLGGECQLSIYPNAGHVNFLQEYRNEWTDDVVGFAGRYIK